MPTYEHQCETCTHEWEDMYSVTAPIPDTCPQCGANTVKRLISLGGKGIVELTGNDLVEKIKQDANQMKRDARNSEKLYANLIGEARYQSLQQSIDKRKRG